MLLGYKHKTQSDWPMQYNTADSARAISIVTRHLSLWEGGVWGQDCKHGLCMYSADVITASWIWHYGAWGLSYVYGPLIAPVEITLLGVGVYPKINNATFHNKTPSYIIMGTTRQIVHNDTECQVASTNFKMHNCFTMLPVLCWALGLMYLLLYVILLCRSWWSAVCPL